MSSIRSVTARLLAAALLTGDWHQADAERRAATALGADDTAWLGALLTRVFQRFEHRPSRLALLAAFIAADAGFQSRWNDLEARPKVRKPSLQPMPGRDPPAALAALEPPVLATTAELAAWLGLDADLLDWLSEPRRGRDHYRYRWQAGRNGKQRLLEIPKQRLAAVQRRILHGLLDRLPPHEAAHGFRRGHSCLSFAVPHAGRRWVLRLDLKDFFPSIPYGRVFRVFASLGYPEQVCRTLARLCTHATPAPVLAAGGLQGAAAAAWRMPHLPHGAPASPALANLCAFRLDLRLAALAGSLGLAYSRYADDMALSGDGPPRRIHGLHLLVCRIALEEGFEINTRKTRLMKAGSRQVLTGLTVNAKVNAPRDEYDRLKAILHNCARFGPDSQNREGHPRFRAHLQGRIAYIHSVSPARAARLRAVFEQVRWRENGDEGVESS